MALSSRSQLVELQQTLYNSRKPIRQWLHCVRRDWIVAAIRRFATDRSGALALEVGPGSGVYLPTLSQCFEKVVASDIEVAYLDNINCLSKQYSNLELVLDDITKSDLAEASFDLILCSEVIEHISDSQAALAGMYRLLKPGGILILSTPQKWSPLEVLAKIAFLPGVIDIVKSIYGEPILKTGHINLLTADQVVNQLHRAGFNVCERFKSGVYLPLVAEFAGRNGLKLVQYLEKKIQDTALDWLLWTQYYIAAKPKHFVEINSTL